MQKHQTILLVEDEDTLRDVVRRYMEREGYRLIEATNGQEALDILMHESPDLIILDVMLPYVDGFAIANAIRSGSLAYSGIPQAVAYAPFTVADDVPIIMLTSRSDEIDRITGFEIGVDDYVIKPFSPRELVARVKAVLRRAAPDRERQTEKPLQFTNLTIDPRRRVVMVGSSPVTLTTKEFDLLWTMARSPQQVFTREQLLDRVWGYEFFGDESTVTVHIRRLREKIEDDPSKPVRIQTVWGIGYRFEPE